MLSQAAVEHALRSLISDLDYDLHKNLESDEEDGTDHYPNIAFEFIAAYNDFSPSE